MQDLEKNSFNTFKELIAFINGLIGSKELINEEKLGNAIKAPWSLTVFIGSSPSYKLRSPPLYFVGSVN